MGDVEYFLKAVYEYKDQYKKSEITVPKIVLPIFKDKILINYDIPSRWDSLYGVPERTINLGFGHLNIVADENNHIYTERILEEYPQKMTMEELEKKLGHKVEIVSKKG